jgi:hypothetical protein
VTDGMRAATDALFILRGVRPPFGVGGSPTTESATVAVSMQGAREAVGDLRTPDGSKAMKAATEALQSLADLLTALAGPAAEGPPPSVAQVRLQAMRLHRRDPLSLDESAWVKAGLDSALTGLEQLMHARAAEPGVRLPLTPWIEEARRAVESIDGRTMFTFQRAAIQDAFRTVVTAFAAALSGSAGTPHARCTPAMTIPFPLAPGLAARTWPTATQRQVASATDPSPSSTAGAFRKDPQ